MLEFRERQFVGGSTDRATDEIDVLRRLVVGQPISTFFLLLALSIYFHLRLSSAFQMTYFGIRGNVTIILPEWIDVANTKSRWIKYDIFFFVLLFVLLRLSLKMFLLLFLWLKTKSVCLRLQNDASDFFLRFSIIEFMIRHFSFTCTLLIDTTWVSNKHT